jgi:hypothetical protein
MDEKGAMKLTNNQRKIYYGTTEESCWRALAAGYVLPCHCPAWMVPLTRQPELVSPRNCSFSSNSGSKMLPGANKPYRRIMAKGKSEELHVTPHWGRTLPSLLPTTITRALVIVIDLQLVIASLPLCQGSYSLTSLLADYMPRVRGCNFEEPHLADMLQQLRQTTQNAMPSNMSFSSSCIDASSASSFVCRIAETDGFRPQSTTCGLHVSHVCV